MDVNDLKPNSHRSKEENNKKIVSGETKIKKKNVLSMLVNSFIQEDVEKIEQYVIQDVIIPNIKKTILDSVSTVLYGESGENKNNTSITKDYRKYYKENRTMETSTVARAKTRYQFDNIIFENRADAEEVLSQMRLAIREYDTVSVFDMYDFAGLVTDNVHMKYGWANLDTARITCVHDGYIIKLPRPLPID